MIILHYFPITPAEYNALFIYMENDDDMLNSDTPFHVYGQLNELETGLSTFLPGKLEQNFTFQLYRHLVL